MRLNKKELRLIIIGVLVVFFVFLYLYVVEPAIKNYQGLNKQVVKSKRSLLEAKRLLLAKDKIDENYSLYLPRIKSCNSEQKDSALILKELQNLLTQANLTVVDMRPEAVKDELPFTVYYVRVKTEGAIMGLTDFIYNLNNSSLLLKIEQVQIYKTKGNYLQFQLLISSQVVTD